MLTSIPYIAATNALNEGRVWDIFDDPSIEEDLMIDGFLDTVSLDNIVRAIPIHDILGLLDDIGVTSLLDTNFYLRTNPFAIRPILDLPVFEIHQCYNPNKWVFGAQVFWNHMDRSVFACNSTNISSYINLNQTTLFEKLKELTPLIQSQFPDAGKIEDLLGSTDFDKILELFGGFTVQQRRIGLMFNLWRQWYRTEMRILLPLYYIERNIFTSPDKQEQLEQMFGALDDASQAQFEKYHAVSDKVGFGATRIELDYAFYKTETINIRLGGFTDLPTAFAIAKGLKGTSFNDCKQPTIDLKALFDLIPDVSNITDAAKQQALAILVGDLCRNQNGFLIGALDRLDALLLEAPLGYQHHLGLGALFRTQASLDSMLEEFEWSKRINFNTRISLEWFTPANERRFFIKRITAEDFANIDFSSSDPIIQQSNLEFLEQEIVDKFYPYSITTNVQPGIIFHMTNRWCFCGDVWDINIGSDFWLQTQEKFKKVCASSSLLSHLDIPNGKAPFAYQQKIYGGIGFKIVKKKYTLFFGINGEDTIWHQGIGKDWTASFNIEANF